MTDWYQVEGELARRNTLFVAAAERAWRLGQAPQQCQPAAPLKTWWTRLVRRGPAPRAVALGQPICCPV